MDLSQLRQHLDANPGVYSGLDDQEAADAGNASLGGVDLVQRDTGNAVRFVHEGQAVAVRLTLDSFDNLEAITDRGDMPAGRVCAKGWEPRA